MMSSFFKEIDMPIIKPVNGKHPQIPEDCYVAENATIVGEVTMGVNVVFGLMPSLEVMCTI